MRDPDKPEVCGCGRGYVSLWDGKCGNCRTKKEIKALEGLQRATHKKRTALEELQATIDRTRARISP